MTTETENDSRKPCFEEICIPPEVRMKYFPENTTKFAYDVLPLFQYEDYNKRTEMEVSNNPIYKEQWLKFQEELPMSAKILKPVVFQSNTVPIFANYRRQKVPPEYLASLVAPSSPEAIFKRSK